MALCLLLPLILLGGGLFLMLLAGFSRGAGDTSPVVGLVDGCGQFALGLALIVVVLLLLSIS